MMSLRLTLLLCVLFPRLNAQPTVTLTECYHAARANYPLLKQQALLAQTGELAVASLNTNRQRPQLAINGQATWQSQVTRLPIELPNIAIPTPNKAQYRLTLDAAYTLYDGNLTRLQTDLQRATTATAQQQIELEMNQLRSQVNGLFLNALLTDENRQLTQTLLANLGNRIDKLRSNVRFGTAAPIDVDGIQAEILYARQRLAELDATRRGLRESLALLTDLPIGDSTRLVVENEPDLTSLSIVRPELRLYQLQESLYDTQLKLADNRTAPRLSLFGQGGAGQPGLNMLNSTFTGFFIGGLRLNWNLSAGYTLKNDRQIISLNQQLIANQRDTFQKNLSVQLRQQQTEIDKLRAQLATDADIVALRSRVRQAAAVQLDNGTIAARDYTTELNAENQAQLNQKLHELQLLLAQIQYRTLTGN